MPRSDLLSMSKAHITITSTNPQEWLEFSRPEPPGDELPVQAFVLTIQLSDLRASTEVDLSHYNPKEPLGRKLADLFDEMAAQWGGWNGEKRWAALESPVELSFVHDHVRSVTAHIKMSRDFRNPWEVRTTLLFEPGSMKGIARNVREFLRT